MRIVIKVGSNVLTRSNGTLDVTRLSAIVDQIADLREIGYQVILVSSGAVASGRSEMGNDQHLDSVAQRQLYSAVGQAKLMNRYYEFFKEHQIHVGQILTTRENFSTPEQYQNQRNCLETMLDNGVLPIVNENDTVSITELMFTDNDELSGLVTSMCNAKVLILLSNVDGIYTGDPSDPSSQILREIAPDHNIQEYIQTSHSSAGRGGMGSKVHTAERIASSGIDVYVANGKREHILTDLLCNAAAVPFTHFLPLEQQQGNGTNEVEALLQQAQNASKNQTCLTSEKIDKVLLHLADALEEHIPQLLEANAHDLSRMDPANPKYDRLALSADRLRGIAQDIRNTAALPSPLHIIQKERTLPNGLHLQRVSVPFGVIGAVYEARPNVSFDVFCLCFKAGSACVLKGGSDAKDSNQAIVSLIREVLQSEGIDPAFATLLPATHEATNQLLAARQYIDLLIPRGSSRLIDSVRKHANVPYIETGAGICHTYFDAAGDWKKGRDIICNAKTRRVSVCNALDCVLFHRSRLADLPKICQPLAGHHVTIYADTESYAALEGSYPTELLQHATNESFGTEFLDYKMAIKTVGSLDEALQHIAHVNSRHSESIVTEDKAAAETFLRAVDAACVYANAPTSFTDGAQFGLGAEIGISTQKLHARGPMALEEITTYKWLIRGNGQIRP